MATVTFVDVLAALVSLTVTLVSLGARAFELVEIDWRTSSSWVAGRGVAFCVDLAFKATLGVFTVLVVPWSAAVSALLTFVNIGARETVSLISFWTFAVVSIELGIQWIEDTNTDVGVTFETAHETVNRVNNCDWWNSNDFIIEAIKATDGVVTSFV